MTDRQFLKLSDDWALAHDRLQWIVQKRRKKNGKEAWKGVALVASNKRVLMRVLREKGAEVTPEAEAALTRLPETFQVFLARQDEAEKPDAASMVAVRESSRCTPAEIARPKVTA